MFRFLLIVLLWSYLTSTAMLAQNCPDLPGFTKLGTFDNHSYYLSGNALSWGKANLIAQQTGGYLVSLNSQEENEFLRKQLGNNMVFIGLNDQNQEGVIQWANGEPITLDLSYHNNQNNDFAVMNFWNGNWEMGNKWEERKFVIELDCDNSSTPTNPNPVQVFIFAGQSNMSGAGKSNELNPALKIVPPNAIVKIHFYGYDYTDFSAGNFGPEVEFIQEIAQAHPTQKFLFIKYAWGGTGISAWLPGTYHYQTLKNKVYQALGQLNVDYELAGFLWMQGETDAFNPNDAEQYAHRLQTMISSLRNELGEPNLPVLVGQIDPPNACCAATVQAAEADFVASDAHANLVLTDGLSRCWNDPIHYNSAGQIDLGHRFFESYQTLRPKGFEFHCPENIVKVLEEGDVHQSIAWDMDDFSSDCDLGGDVQVAQTLGKPSGSAFEVGTYTVAYAAMDGCQNTDTCQFSIEVKPFTACPAKIEGFTKLGSFNGHSYFLSENDLTWTDAKDFAEEHGGYLATMTTNEENDFLRSKLNNHMVFIGLSDNDNEGQLNWANGESVSLNLAFGNSDSNDFAVMNFWAGTWELVNKWVAKPYVMEMDCESLDANPISNKQAFMSPIYPNPAKATISFDFDVDTDQAVDFTIFSESGHLFLAEKRDLPKGLSKVTINIGHLPKGRYTIKTIQNRSIHFVKF